MQKQLLEAGKIVNTHGVRGEVKIEPWANGPAFLKSFDRLYLDGEAVAVTSTRAHGAYVIAKLDGIDSMDDAARLKDKTVFINRGDAALQDGEYFIQDLVGLRAVDAESGRELGVIREIMSLPSNDVYVIRGAREIPVPAVPEFVKEVDLGGGRVRFRLIEGM